MSRPSDNYVFQTALLPNLCIFCNLSYHSLHRSMGELVICMLKWLVTVLPHTFVAL
jgi:hypothetical protein